MRYPRINASNSKTRQNPATKIMLNLWFLSLIPIVLAYVMHLFFPDTLLLKSLADMSVNIPGFTSFNSPVLSHVFSFYSKFAPLWGAVFFISAHEKLNINIIASKLKLVGVLMCFVVLYICALYLLVFNDVELTEAKKILGLMSQNDFLIMLLFGMIFTSIYFMTCYLLSYAYAVYLAIK